MPEFQPFISTGENRRRNSRVRAVVLGSIFGIIFGAVTVYVGLRAGLTVAASIPIAVISISILRAFGRASVLEDNYCADDWECRAVDRVRRDFHAAGADVSRDSTWSTSRIFMLALIGGWLGVLFMVPLRRPVDCERARSASISRGHGLRGCAQLRARADGSIASRVSSGLGLGGLYTFFQNENLFGAWPGTPEYRPDFGEQHVMKGASINADATSEYLGVGYIIGSKTGRQ